MRKKLLILLIPLFSLSSLLVSCDEIDSLNTDDPTITDTNSTDEDEYFTVSFDLNYQGAVNDISSQEVKNGELVIKPLNDPERDGFDFVFWSKNMYGSEEWVFSTDVVTKNLTLYASWTPMALVEKTYYVEIPLWWDFDGAVASIYMWDEDENYPAPWPGELMDHVNGRIYSFEIPDEYDNFIFARVSPNLEDWGAKTINLNKDMAGSHNLYTINEEVVWGDPGCSGVWSTYTR